MSPHMQYTQVTTITTKTAQKPEFLTGRASHYDDCNTS